MLVSNSFLLGEHPVKGTVSTNRDMPAGPHQMQRYQRINEPLAYRDVHPIRS